ncbi:Phosphate regulon transcriptional regulatory protein PhoB [Mesonia oceanica]|uniref:Phosphate regulon transcriptional regulatory protein PhoB n=1 Tax=Mesonia oceanica TaxID=2687242 RepID=A0AC61Y991_9FLAO|nr:Phosphate regulon transcriptional regulatory protein PhoB [Mesonia oceanica]|tara:strand:+ start:113367 stop:113825 length:459 start_codon:yes stop_codon:yes gene_type:complete
MDGVEVKNEGKRSLPFKVFKMKNKINLACIIDDDPIFIFGTKKMLEYSGYCDTFLIFKNGKEAYDHLSAILREKETLPDVIFLDINMPIMNGWQFLEKITKIDIPAKLKIFVVSSSETPEDREKAKEFSAIKNYVVKPISVSGIKDIIRQIE